jgi:hypothetical protein
MKNLRFKLQYFLIVLIVISSSSCRKQDDNFSPTVVSEKRSGKLTLTQGTSMKYSDLSVLSYVEQTELDNFGSFKLNALGAEKYQQLYFISKETKNTIYIGLYDPRTKKIMANDTSTVLSLLLYNPHLLETTQAQRQTYIELTKKNSRFSKLLSYFNESMKNDPENVFDIEKNPLLYQTAVQIMQETILTMQSGGAGSKSLLISDEGPTIEDATGANITFVNPRHVYYGAGIYQSDEKLKDVALVLRQEYIVSFNWDLNNLVGINVPARTNYALGDGQYRIYLTKGLKFTNFDWGNPEGRATIANTGKIIESIFDLILGEIKPPPLIKLPQYFHIKDYRVYQLGKDIYTGNVFGFISHFLGTIVDNGEGIALWIWQSAVDDAARNAAHLATQQVINILGNVSTAFKLLSFANGPGPLFWDAIFAPAELNYYITLKDGLITSTKENVPPSAKFVITPPAGIVTTDFLFDASGSSDDVDLTSQLKYRWDFESDGTWDTDWSSNLTVNHTYAIGASYSVTLAVLDNNGLTGTTSHYLNVGGGSGTANHVKLFMDSFPWKSDAMVRMLKGNGFAEGTGSKTYEIISSSSMSTVPLIPGTDLVIISNDQTQTFYNNYAASQVRFTSFVNNGGALFWEACDKGWNYGSMETAGLSLPGNIQANYLIDSYNYVADPNLPLVAGLPLKMDHNYASHEYFTSLPDGTTIYCTGTNKLPTLIEFNFGAGWIIMTGQPLEHQFDRIYGSPDMEILLPAIVSYFTGTKMKKAVVRSLETGPAQPSYIPLRDN